MPAGLKRYQKSGHLHFITFSCYRRLPYLASDKAKQVFTERLEKTRLKHEFEVIAYVVMPEHVHLLLTEPPNVSLDVALKSLKQETSRILKGNRDHFWQARYYDFNVFTTRKIKEKIDYIHTNPVIRGLASEPEDWRWSSATSALGMVTLESA
jgi:putative transposase